MNATWPDAIQDFELFLAKAGLTPQERLEDPAATGNRLVQYGGVDIAVRVVSDRYKWYVEVAEPVTQPADWYDAAILRDLLVGRGEDVLSLPEQIGFVQTNWAGIVGCFDPVHREDSHSRLVVLRRERVRRRIPGLL